MRWALQGLSCEVLGNIVTPFIDASLAFPFLNEYLDTSRMMISEIYSLMPENIFNMYEGEIREKQKEKFFHSKRKWEERKVAS